MKNTPEISSETKKVAREQRQKEVLHMRTCDSQATLKPTRTVHLNTDEFTLHEAESPFGWIEHEIAHCPSST